jgi:hypothetical protein
LFTGKANIHWLGIKVDGLKFRAFWKQNLPLKCSLPRWPISAVLGYKDHEERCVQYARTWQ